MGLLFNVIKKIYTIDIGRRHSAATAFIDPIMFKRPNLHVLLEARVTKVLIDPATRKAYGVEYVKNKRKYQVTALKEVVDFLQSYECLHL